MRCSPRSILARTSASVLVSLATFACGDDGVPPMTTIAPEDVGDGWVTSTPAAEGMDGDALSRAFLDVQFGQYPHVDGMVVVRNDRIVAEGYFNGYGRDGAHDLRSASKSITSALAGIAVDQGRLAVGDRISAHLPGFESYRRMDDLKRSITVLDLLNMQSGLPCEDSDPSSPGNEDKMYEQENWTKFLLDLPMQSAPGRVAQYCTAGVVLLGNVVANATEMPLEEFAARYLFEPLGITELSWRRSPDGRAAGGGGMRLRPRDSAKLGQLFLDQGTWNGARVISDAWVRDSQQILTQIDGRGYGYLWWKRSFSIRGGMQDCYFAQGNGGNVIFVAPAERLVVMISGSNYDRPASSMTLLSRGILPALL